MGINSPLLIVVYSPSSSKSNFLEESGLYCDRVLFTKNDEVRLSFC